MIIKILEKNLLRIMMNRYINLYIILPTSDTEYIYKYLDKKSFIKYPTSIT